MFLSSSSSSSSSFNFSSFFMSSLPTFISPVGVPFSPPRPWLLTWNQNASLPHLKSHRCLEFIYTPFVSLSCVDSLFISYPCTKIKFHSFIVLKRSTNRWFLNLNYFVPYPLLLILQQPQKQIPQRPSPTLILFPLIEVTVSFHEVVDAQSARFQCPQRISTISSPFGSRHSSLYLWFFFSPSLYRSLSLSLPHFLLFFHFSSLSLTISFILSIISSFSFSSSFLSIGLYSLLFIFSCSLLFFHSLYFMFVLSIYHSSPLNSFLIIYNLNYKLNRKDRSWKQWL